MLRWHRSHDGVSCGAQPSGLRGAVDAKAPPGLGVCGGFARAARREDDGGDLVDVDLRGRHLTCVKWLLRVRNEPLAQAFRPLGAVMKANDVGIPVLYLLERARSEAGRHQRRSAADQRCGESQHE